MASVTGAQVIARALHDLGTTVLFGLVGIPVVDIAEEAINLGIRFIAFRNEQACSYAATAYGYMTGRPGVCLLVGGPGVLHGMAGIGNSSVNGFPALFLAGSSERNLTTKGAFQEMDAISLLTPHTKCAIRPASNDPAAIYSALESAYRSCWYGRPGPSFVDLPADLIMDTMPSSSVPTNYQQVSAPPRPSADPNLITEAAQLLRSSSSPLIILGKGAAYAQAESAINTLITSANIPFLPTPMGKGIVSDSSPLNTSSARSTALREADVILLLGARLNWILHFGAPPKFRKDVKIIQVDICAEELGRTNGMGDRSLSLLGDVSTVVQQLQAQLKGWQAFSNQLIQNPTAKSYPALLHASTTKNVKSADSKALAKTSPGAPMTYQRAFHIIKETLHSLSPPEDGGIVYVSEGANTMDISRSAFPVSHPRQRLDAGTHATMGVGMGYAIAAYAAYNLNEDGGTSATAAHASKAKEKEKKIVCLEGDSAFGFSAMEIETMARQKMPILIFVMNNSGVYHGDTSTAEEWEALQAQTVDNATRLDNDPDPSASNNQEKKKKKGLRSTSLWYETRYENLAHMVGGKGYFVRSEEELEIATKEGFGEREKVVLVNVVIEPGLGKTIQFNWQQKEERPKSRL